MRDAMMVSEMVLSPKKRFFLFLAPSAVGGGTAVEETTGRRRRGVEWSLSVGAFVRCVVVVMVTNLEPFPSFEGGDGSIRRTISGGDRHGWF